MEIELGKRYVIKKETPVFSIDLQQNVMFERSIVVEARQTFRNITHSPAGSLEFCPSSMAFFMVFG